MFNVLGLKVWGGCTQSLWLVHECQWADEVGHGSESQHQHQSSELSNMSFLTIHFCCILLLKAKSSVSAEEEVSSRGGIAFTETSKISETGIVKQITSSHSVDSQINCAFLCGQMSDRDGACNAFSYEGTISDFYFGRNIYNYDVKWHWHWHFFSNSILRWVLFPCKYHLSGGWCLWWGCRTGSISYFLHLVLVQHAGDGWCRSCQQAGPGPPTSNGHRKWFNHIWRGICNCNTKGTPPEKKNVFFRATCTSFSPVKDKYI